MDASKNEMVANFASITGVDADRAQFYLESSGWKLDIAMESFYSGDGDDEPMEQAPEPAAQPPPEQQPAAAKPTAKPKSRFGTIQNLQQDDSDNEEGQAFYAGGHEQGGGQQVLGPSKKKNTEKIVKDLFESAKEHGAETVESSGAPRASGSAGTTRFVGSGYRLGESNEAPTQMVQGAAAPSKPKEVDMVLKLWKEGFSVDDGELRRYDDPDNKEFLDTIKKGEVPRELLRLAKGGEVNLNMEDHRTEDFVKPKKPVKAFGGSGNRLGRDDNGDNGTLVTPPVVENTTPSTDKTNESTAQSTVTVNESQPTTNVQIRLADGSRLVAKFNHTHTVGDIRTYITTARPQYAEANFVLMTTFPSKELSDLSASLKDAQLLNAVLVQRLK